MKKDELMNQPWHIIYYSLPSGSIPVREFLDDAGPKLKTKAFRIFQHIQEYGLVAAIPHIKKLSGTPLYEIRILGGDSARILFITQMGQTIVLLHAFYKKTQKTPQKEIATAFTRLKDFEKRK